jgi:ornithine carbamoyltransferase
MLLALLASASSAFHLAPGTLRMTSPDSRQPAARLNAANCDTNLPAGQRHFLHVDDLSSSEVREVMELAKKIKGVLKGGGSYKPFAGQTLAMIFTKPSCRTRVSFESGYWRLGGHSLCLGSEVGIGTREATKDVSRVLASMNDMIMARLYLHKDMLELAEFSKVPVINGLTNYNHPCQIIADALTVEEVMPDGTMEGKKVVYVGDGNNVVHSWLELALRIPFHFVCACPPGYEPNSDLIRRVNASGVGTCEVVVGDPKAAVKGADVIYADVWASMQQKDEAAAREEVFKPYQVNEELMAASGKEGTIFLHCLPAERGREVTDGVMESSQSHVFRQSENRMHAQNAIMVFCAGVERPP